MIDYGTDIDTRWIFKDGDIKLTENNDNIIQALQHRLMTPQGHFQWCYGYHYGSDLRDIIGEYNSEQIGDYACISIRYSLIEDPRVHDITEINYTRENGQLIINVTVQLTGDEEKLALRLILTEENQVQITGDLI